MCALAAEVCAQGLTGLPGGTHGNDEANVSFSSSGSIHTIKIRTTTGEDPNPYDHIAAVQIVADIYDLDNNFIKAEFPFVIGHEVLIGDYFSPSSYFGSEQSMGGTIYANGGWTSESLVYYYQNDISEAITVSDEIVGSVSHYVSVSIDMSHPDMAAWDDKIVKFLVQGVYRERADDDNYHDGVSFDNSAIVNFGSGNDKARIDYSSMVHTDTEGLARLWFNVETQTSLDHLQHLEYLDIDYSIDGGAYRGLGYIRHNAINSDYSPWPTYDNIYLENSYRLYFSNEEGEWESGAISGQVHDVGDENRMEIRINTNEIPRFSNASDVKFRIKGQFRNSSAIGISTSNVEPVYSEVLSLSEEDGNPANEVDITGLPFDESGANRIGFNLEKREVEKFFDHVGCLVLYYRPEGGSWSKLMNIRHNASIFSGGDCDPVSSPATSDTFGGPDGDQYTFSTTEEARIFAREGKYYTSVDDVPYEAGTDAMIYVTHYINPEDFGKRIEYKLGGVFYERDLFGKSSQIQLWNNSGTDDFVDASKPDFTQIPDIAAPTVQQASSECGVEISWIEPQTAFGDADRHKILIYRNGEIIAELDAHDASHGNSFIDTDIDRRTNYAYQLQVAYQRYANGWLKGNASSAVNFQYPLLAAPSGLGTEQTDCGGGITVAWTMGDNPDYFKIQRKDDNSGFTTVAEVEGDQRSYIDNHEIEAGKVYYYQMTAVDDICGFEGTFTSVHTHTGDTVDISLVINKAGLKTSKGYFSDRTELFWETTGFNEAFATRYKIFGRELGTDITPVLLQTVDRDTRSWFHERGDAGVIYEYFVVAERVVENDCGIQTTLSYPVDALEGELDIEALLPEKGVAYNVGLRSPAAVVNGNITYSGGIPVPDVKVIAEKDGNQTGKSLYFDGTDHISVPNSEVLMVDTALTLSAWIKPENLSPNVMLFKHGSYGLEFNGSEAFMFIRDTVDQTAHVVQIPSADFKVGNWVNLMCTYRSTTGELNLYINGVNTGSPTIVPEGRRIINKSEWDFLIGKYHSPGYNFQGHMDEIRIYNRALSANEVKREYGRSTVTDAEGLVAYWKIFEGAGKYVYDAAHKGSAYYKNDGEIMGASWSDDIPSVTQLGIAGYTDDTGNYTIAGVTYEGNGENYRIVPTITLGGVVHEFDPGSKVIFLGEGNGVENGVDFEDISSFNVAGNIRFLFENTEEGGVMSSGSAGVSIWLDGVTEMKTLSNASIVTDANGAFSVDVPIGHHFLEFRKFGHTFSEARFPASGTHDFQEDVSGLEIWDETTHKLVGTVLGSVGARDLPFISDEIVNNIGKAYFTITSDDGLISREVVTDSLTGKYNINLPPKKYTMSSIRWSADDEEIIASSEIEPIDLSHTSAYQPIVEIDSASGFELSQTFPIADVTTVISDFKLDTLKLEENKLEFTWTLDQTGMVGIYHLRKENDNLITSCCDGLDPGHTFFTPGTYSDYLTYSDELPTEIYLKYIDGSGNEYEVGIDVLTNEPIVRYDTLGTIIDSLKYNVRQDYEYRVAPSLVVSSIEGDSIRGESNYAYNLGDEVVNVDLTQLRYPSFFSRSDYSILMRAVELYVNKDNETTYSVPVSDGQILVNNGIGQGYFIDEDGGKNVYPAGQPIELDERGELVYYFKPSDPNTTEITSSGLEYESYTKSISATLTVGNQVATWPETPGETFKAYVMGAKAVGDNFISLSPTTVEFVLRDPPGSNSYAYREAGVSSSISEEYYTGGFLDSETSGSIGFGGNPSVGLWGWVNIEVEIEVTASAGIKASSELGAGGDFVRTIETTETISTNDEPIQIGKSDVFVTKTNNLITGTGLYVNPIPVELCGGNCFGDVITLGDGSQYQLGVTQQTFTHPQGSPTYAVYSESHIVNVLIPDLEDIRDSYFFFNPKYTSKLSPDHAMFGSNNDDPVWGTDATTTNAIKTEEEDFDGPSYTFDWDNDPSSVDSVRWVNQQIRLWKEALAVNEIEKWKATNSGNAENVSLASGVTLERTKTSSSSESSFTSFETSSSVTIGANLDVTAVVALKLESNTEVGVKASSKRSVENSQTITTGYVLSEPDEDDALSINVVDGAGNNGTIFSTVGGQTTCPHEPAIEMQYVTPEYLDRNLAEMQAVLDELKTKRAATVAGTAQLNELINVISEEMTDLGNQIKKKIEEKAARTVSFSRLIALATNPDAIREEYEAALNEIAETINFTQQQIDRLASKVAFIQREIAIYDVRVADLTNEIEEVEASIANVNALKGDLLSGKVYLSQPTLQREKPSMLINGAEQAQIFNIPAEEQGNFTLLMANESESGDAQYYAVELLDETNPDGLILKIDGANISSGREFLIPGNGAIQKIMTVERGPFEYSYEDVKVIIRSTCQYDPTGNDALIADTVSFNIEFLPVCTDVEITSPNQNWTANNSFDNVMPIIVGGYDVNGTGFEKVKILYKESSNSEWNLLETVYRDSTITGWESEMPVLPKSGNSFTYNWDVSQLPDGNYDIQVVSVCALAESESEIYSGIIDRVSPHPFGTPEPADGIYSAGDEIAIQFNEPLNEGLIRPSDFKITGVLNGGEVRHNASVYFEGVGAQYMEIPKGLDFTRKSFTIEMYVKRAAIGEEILFAQGGAVDRSILIGFDASDQPYMSINGQVLTAITGVTDNMWHHLAFVYDHGAGDALIYDNAVSVGVDNSFESDYQSAGRVFVAKSTFGDERSFEGNIHELRVWNKPLIASEVNLVATKRMSANETGLVGNWMMEEASGDVALDHVRSKHAQVYGQWAIEPGGLAYQFDGLSRVEAQSPAFSHSSDFTIEFWVKGSPVSDSVTFIANGTGDGQDANTSGWAIGADSQSQLIVKSNGQVISPEVEILDDSWHHVAVSVNRVGNVTCFIDGQEVGKFSADLVEGFGGSALLLGARGWYNGSVEVTDQYFSGALDEVRIWALARRSNDIDTDIQNKLTGNETGLVLYYPFESYQDIGGGVLSALVETHNQTSTDLSVENDLQGTQVGQFIENTPAIKLPRPVQAVSFNYSSNADKVILSPAVDPEVIEDVILTISAKNLKDVNGNAMVSPASWTAFVDRSTLNWVENEKILEIPLGEGATFEATIYNRGGNVESFTLANLPGWLTASPVSGSVAPLESQAIRFAVSDATNIGSYVEDVVMENSFGFDEKLILNLDVYQAPPEDWNVNPADYEYSMSVLGRIRIYGEFSRDEDDLIAAFVDGECRGVAALNYTASQDNYQTFVSIYSNELEGESIEYRIWNASEGLVHSFVSASNEAVDTFVADAFHGSISDPVVFDGGANIEQAFDVVSGWQWLSFNLSSAEMSSTNTFMSNFPSADGDQIKSNAFFDQYDEENGWLGTITSNGGIQSGEMYKFRLTNSDKLKVKGEPVDPASNPIALQAGWNWVSFLGQNMIPVNEALASVTGLQIGDVIKSQRQFATYGGPGVGWIGSLETMVPGDGYLYRAANAGSIVYPKVAATAGRVSAPNFEYLNIETFEVPVTHFQDNMTLTIQTDQAYEMLVAYAGGEVRGVAQPQFNPITGTHGYFLTVYGHAADQLAFRGFNSGIETELYGQFDVAFSSENTIGRLDASFFLTAAPLSISDFDQLNIYPNPVADVLTIELDETPFSSFNVRTLSGKVVASPMLQTKDKKVEIDLGHLSSGVYLLHFEGENGSNSLKLIKQ
ncbi:MAG: LamG-like jellyroll fold domain-containing protein [Cyclobacteriaceae bacterium]